MISQDKIDEWIHEVEDRPISARLIIQYIANRLSELSAREEELEAQNIELLSGRKVEEYENRIASLEYQLELLKRQLGGEVVLPSEVPATPALPERLNLLAYNLSGQVLCRELLPGELTSGLEVGRIADPSLLNDLQPGLLVTGAQEELLFIFDSGRTVTHPAAQIPAVASGELDWKQAFFEEPRIREELAAIQPIAKMSLSELCIQASRRGFVKKIKTSLLASHITENYIGMGVRMPSDKTCGLTFASKEDLFVMVSQEGYIFSMAVDHLPISIEEVLQLGITDHIVSAFIVGQKPSILFVTQNGKLVHRDPDWLEGARSFRTKGQALLSKERREAGTRLIAAAPVEEAQWGVFLHSDGTLTTQALGELISTGSVPSHSAGSTLLGFTTFQLPKSLSGTTGEMTKTRKPQA